MRARVSGLLALLLLFSLADRPVRAADLMKKQPYLIYPGELGRMKVLWQLTAR